VLLLRNSVDTVFLLLMRATCSAIFISKCKFKISNMLTQNKSYTNKIIKIHFSPKILNVNQMLITFFPPYITFLKVLYVIRFSKKFDFGEVKVVR